MADVSVVNASTVWPRTAQEGMGMALPASPCAACSQHVPRALGQLPPALLMDMAMADNERFPRFADAQHRQILQVSPAEIVATGVTNVTFDSITLHLEGTIGGLPYDLDLDFSLDLSKNQVVVTLKLVQPAAYEGSWTFKLYGLSPSGGDRAAVVQPSYTHAALLSTSLPALSGVIGALIKCLGPQVIGIVLKCLPSLVSGKQAFLACLIQNAETALPTVIQCIQQNP